MVNQPMVREVSMSLNRSSRPWPSMPISTLPCPVQRDSTRLRALSSTSLTWVRYTPGTLRSNASVSSRSSWTDRVRAASMVFDPIRSTGSSTEA